MEYGTQNADSPPAAFQRRSRGRVRLSLLGGILVLAMALRAVGIGATIHHPDEGNIRIWVLRMLDAHSLEPPNMSYGSLTFYLQILVSVPFRWVSASFVSAEELGTTWISVVGRVLSVIYSVVTVWMTALMARTLVFECEQTRWVPPLAALFMTVAFLPVQLSHYATVDNLLALLTTSSICAALMALVERRPLLYVLSGICVGLAAATKYTGILSVMPLVTSWVLFPGRRWNWIAKASLASVLSFVAAMPYAVIQPLRLLEAIRFESRHYETVTRTRFAAGPDTALWNLDYLFSSGLGPGLTVLAGLGLLFLLSLGIQGRGKPLWPRVLVFLLYPATAFVFISRYPVRFDRNLLPLLPFLCICAALYLGQAHAILGACCGHWRRFSTPLFLTVVLLCIAFPLERSVIFDWQLGYRSTQSQLLDWQRTLPPSIKVAGHGFEQRRDLKMLRQEGYDYVVMSSHSLIPVFLHPERYPDLYRRYLQILRHCRLAFTFENPWFSTDFFAPHRLLNSATVNIYHGPTLWVFSVPLQGKGGRASVLNPEERAKEDEDSQEETVGDE